jgi:hypothetical protein
MVGVHRRHPDLSILNTEAAASVLGAKMVLSPPTASGQLAAVLPIQDTAFRTVDLPYDRYLSKFTFELCSVTRGPRRRARQPDEVTLNGSPSRTTVYECTVRSTLGQKGQSWSAKLLG